MSRTDEVFNSPGDLAYPYTATGTSIRLGNIYKMRAEDSLYSVGHRFGMQFISLLVSFRKVNVDNQNENMLP